MIHKKLLSLLVLLMTVASGAWATSDISRALLSVPNSWGKDQAVFLTAEELPGFKAVTEEEAANWVPTDEDIENGAFLIYGFDAEGNMLSYATLMGAPAIKVDPGKMPHNNMYGLTHGSMLQVRFYYTSDVTLVGDKTEATFAMPAADATVDYELVRDMSVQMTTKVGDGADGADYRIRLKKKDDKWEPADLTVAQVMGKFKVHDALENKDLTFYGEGAVCDISIYAVDDQDQPTGNAIAFADLEPGRYVAIAKAADGSAYDGQTAQSNVLVLFQGYEVTVPSKEFVTYYKDEPLYADPQTSADAQLYTITSVSDDKAVLSDAITTAPSNTPLLIYNAGNTDQTFLLIPAAAEPNLALTVAPEFIGTTEATTIAASTSTKNNYALNGKQFVWVKNAISIAANKAYLSVTTGGQLHAPALSIVSGDATGIDSMVNGQWSMDTWYDLNGRKLDKKPTQKGIYINNGRKVVIK